MEQLSLQPMVSAQQEHKMELPVEEQLVPQVASQSLTVPAMEDQLSQTLSASCADLMNR